MNTVEWDSFAQGLSEVLAGLPAGAILVISEPGAEEDRRYVQFVQEPNRLIAEVVTNSFLDAARQASAAGESLIASAGWRPREPSLGRENWWTELPWPSSSQQYSALAEMVVTALRDGYGIADPGGFRYRAWNERRGNEDIELPSLGLPRET